MSLGNHSSRAPVQSRHVCSLQHLQQLLCPLRRAFQQCNDLLHTLMTPLRGWRPHQDEAAQVSEPRLVNTCDVPSATCRRLQRRLWRLQSRSRVVPAGHVRDTWAGESINVDGTQGMHQGGRCPHLAHGAVERLQGAGEGQSLKPVECRAHRLHPLDAVPSVSGLRSSPTCRTQELLERTARESIQRVNGVGAYREEHGQLP
jgi:hypothetical protein